MGKSHQYGSSGDTGSVVENKIARILAEYTDEFLHDWYYWRPMLEPNVNLYTLSDEVDMDDVVRANLWIDLKNKIAKVSMPSPGGKP